MSFNKSSVIQLRELSSSAISDLDANYINGQFEIITDELTVDEGDMLQVKSCIIDSAEAEAGKIEILEEEENFSITFNHYVKNYETHGKTYNRGGTTPQQPDGLHYFLCDTFDAQGNTVKVDSITFNRYSAGGGKWGGVWIIMEYTKAGQLTQSPSTIFNVYVPKTHIRDATATVSAPTDGLGFNANANFPVNIYLSKNNTYNLLNKYNVDYTRISHTTTTIDAGTQRSAHDFTIDFTIPKGVYDPTEFARMITDKTSVLRPDENTFGGSNPMKSPLLTTSTQFVSEFPSAVVGGKVEYVSETGENFFTTDDNAFSGSSQFGLQFDIGINKFKLVIINNPYYNAGNISVKGLKVGTANDYFLVNKTCGLTIKAMTPYNVWFEKMGMNPNIIFQSTGTITKDFSPTETGQTQPVFSGLIEGINTTGSYKGLDIIVEKLVGNGQNCPETLDILASTNAQNIIYAKNPLQSSNLAYGYFMIDISMGIDQDFKGGDFNKNSVQAIIGRYYSTNSFTTAYSEGSVPYVHRGESIKLSRFKVRILDDTGNNSDDIGDNNTVFLELIKNVSAPSSITMPIPLNEFLQLQNKGK